MTFRDDLQLAGVCGALLKMVRLGDLWTPNGPTDLACKYRDEGGPFSSGERVVFGLAWELWNGSARASFGDVLYGLDHELRARLGFLLLCRDEAAVERWLEASKLRR